MKENKIYKREGRVTPKYSGYFVSFWKKENGKNIPYKEDEVDQLTIETIDGNFILSKEDLIERNVLSSNTCKGKLGFRIGQKSD